MRFRTCALFLVCSLAPAGCDVREFPAMLPATTQQIDEIVGQSGASAQDKRDELRTLGIDDLTINALLRAERTGNQFGGDLRSAYEKISGGALRQLTPDEIQIFGDAAANSGSDFSGSIDDTAAAAIARFFTDQSIDDGDALTMFLDNEGSEVPSDIPNDTLRPLFVDFDPDDVLSQFP